VMQFSPPSSHSIPLWPKYSPQHPVLKHPQFMFISYLFTHVTILLHYISYIMYTSHKMHPSPCKNMVRYTQLYTH
jgi:hypothetical protein